MHLRVLKAILLVLLVSVGALWASSHMDAPAITLDPAANTTDVYAFRSAVGGQQYLTTALSVYPHQEPGIGPNKYNFDDNVLYQIHVSLGDDLAAGRATLSYQFRFTTTYRSEATILQSYLGVVQDVGDAGQNLLQTYSVTRVDHRTGATTTLGTGRMVPPNNQGVATPFYNLADNGENPAKPGVSAAANLDRYTAQGVYEIGSGHRVFAGQREDGFYGDIQAIFDLLQLRTQPQDSQAGFNVHTIVIDIPLSELGGGQQVVGVYATTSRRRDPEGEFVQVGRQGNPLFAEALVAIADKDRYNQTSPEQDTELFAQYALQPELAALINLIVFGGDGPAVETGRTDLAGIFIPDLIKVDLSTGPARLAGPPDDEGFSRLSVFGGDVLTSTVQAGLPGFPAGTIPGGWPNGRRFGDDVIDIAVTAVISDLRNDPLVINGPAGDNLNSNDAVYNKVFPYAGTPLNGRVHVHESFVDAATNLEFAHFGNGLGLTSDIVLTNTSTTRAVSGSLEFTDMDGQPVDVGIVAGPGIVPRGASQAANRIDFVLPISGTVTISTDGQGPLVSGAVRVTSQSPLGGVIRFSIPGIGIAGVQPSQPVTGFSTPVRRTASGISTGVALHNLEQTPVDIHLRLLNPDGSERATTTIEGFVANAQTARFIDQLFEQLGDELFQGTLVATVTGGRINAMALELGNAPGQFTTLPVTPLN